MHLYNIQQLLINLETRLDTVNSCKIEFLLLFLELDFENKIFKRNPTWSVDIDIRNLIFNRLKKEYSPLYHEILTSKTQSGDLFLNEAFYLGGPELYQECLDKLCAEFLSDLLNDMIKQISSNILHYLGEPLRLCLTKLAQLNLNQIQQHASLYFKLWSVLKNNFPHNILKPLFDNVENNQAIGIMRLAYCVMTKADLEFLLNYVSTRAFIGQDASVHFAKQLQLLLVHMGDEQALNYGQFQFLAFILHDLSSENYNPAIDLIYRSEIIQAFLVQHNDLSLYYQNYLFYLEITQQQNNENLIHPLVFIQKRAPHLERGHIQDYLIQQQGYQYAQINRSSSRCIIS
jgi:hypothetical protein